MKIIEADGFEFRFEEPWTRSSSMRRTELNPHSMARP
jgi:hypothetical protein